jgi:hypothetical protein
MFDIAKLDTRTRAEAGAKMTVLRPQAPYDPIRDADGHPLTITLRGVNSDSYRAAQREANQRAADARSFQARRSQEDEDLDTVELLCAATVDWSFDTKDGQPFPFSPENARALWSDGRWRWLRTQAINFITTEGNFLAA